MIALNETNEYAAEVAFNLPLSSDPLTGLTGYTFTSGEVQIRLPGQPWTNASLSQIVEKGYGRFCVRLLPTQTLVAGDVFIRAIVSGTQYYFGSDIIGTLGGDIKVGSTSGTVSFFLPSEVDPIYGAPLTGHAFSAGEVRVCVPDSAYTDADPSQVDEIGYGGYRLRLTSIQTAKAGKVFVYAKVDGYQRWEGYCTVLDATGGTTTTVVTPPEPVPVPVPVTFGDPEYVNQYALALNRLPQQFRSGTLEYGQVAVPAPALSDILGEFTPSLPVTAFGVPFDFVFNGTEADVPTGVLFNGVLGGTAPHLSLALSRLPQQFRSGDLVYDLPPETTVQQLSGTYVPGPAVEYTVTLPVVTVTSAVAHLAVALSRLPQQFRVTPELYPNA